MISDCPLLDGSITTDRNGISSCFVAKALCRTCPCQDSHVSISEWSAIRTEIGSEEPLCRPSYEWRAIRPRHPDRTGKSARKRLYVLDSVTARSAFNSTHTERIAEIK
jgi:hypothetical protein